VSETAWSGETRSHTTIGRTCMERGTEVEFWRTFASVGSPYHRLAWEKHLPADSATYPLSPASGGGVQGTSLVCTSFDGRWALLPHANMPNRNVLPAPGLQSHVLGISCILWLQFVCASRSAGTTSLCSRVGWGMGLPEEPAAPQLVKKFPAFYTVPRFITVFTTAGYLSLSSHPSNSRPSTPLL
jgi:hypothetical protein